MTDRPIIFSAPMAKAIISGRKSMTRRLLRAKVPAAPAMDAIAPGNAATHPAPYLDAYCSEPHTAANPRGMSQLWCWWTRDNRCGATFKVPYMPGDQLWVRETWKPHSLYAHLKPSEVPKTNVFYAANGGYSPSNTPWNPSIYMPRWASRLTLTITGVKLERLQDITEEEALAEGVQPGRNGWWSGAEGQAGTTPRAAFALLWNSLHGAGAWDVNPTVVALTFTVAHRNIDAA